MVIGELCDWVFSSPQYKRQFEVWLDTVYPLKGQAEDIAKAKGEAESMREQARQDVAEEEAHEERDYSEERGAELRGNSTTEKENVANKQETTPQVLHLKRQPPRYTHESKNRLEK